MFIETFDDKDVWYGKNIMDTNWPALFMEVSPFLTFIERNMLLDIAGKDSVNPALLLTTAIYYKNETMSNFKTFIEDISVKVMKCYFVSSNRTAEQINKENNAAHTLSLLVDNDQKQTSELIAIYNAVKKELVKHQKPPGESYVEFELDSEFETEFDTSIDFQRMKRAEGLSTSLIFPFRSSECWMLSATHHSNQQCNARTCPKGAIDMAPNLFMGFGHGFEYFNSDGHVIASHSGTIYVHSPCSLQVQSPYYNTFYSHISVERRTNDFVRAGDILGKIQLDPYNANCNCEVAAGDTECSTGPHLHWELRDSDNRPMDLNGIKISNFMVKTGSESYDIGCENSCHNNMTMEEVRNTCSTVFVRLDDNVTFCPSVQGANFGRFLINKLIIIITYRFKSISNIEIYLNCIFICIS